MCAWYLQTVPLKYSKVYKIEEKPHTFRTSSLLDENLPCNKILLCIQIFSSLGNDPNQLENNVVHELSLFSDWFIANKLSLNINKTNFIVFNNTHNYVFNISTNGQKLEPAKSVKFLGVIIDCKLTWQEHINHISSKIARGIGVIGRLRHLLPKSILRTIYLTLVYPHLMYYSTV